MTTVKNIRQHLAHKFKLGEFVTDKTGVKTIELVGSDASFVADEPSIFGAVNHEYVAREIAWYESLSRNVNDIPGGPPKIWKQVATPDGRINSNYGWCIWSNENHNQYLNVRNQLFWKPDSRRAVMIYTRPSMHDDYDTDGMSDFICTNAVQYLIRSGKLHAVVQMRSNDAWAGYRNDWAWQRHVQKMLLADLNVNRVMLAEKDGLDRPKDYELGDIHWTVGSLHLYENQFYLVEHFLETGETSIDKAEFQKRRSKT